MILLTLGKRYGGQKINGQSLHYSNPCIVSEAVYNRQIARIDTKTHHITEGVKLYSIIEIALS